VALIGRLAIPRSSLSKVLWGSDAYIVGKPNLILRIWIALVGEDARAEVPPRNLRARPQQPHPPAAQQPMEGQVEWTAQAS
jgi:hypothetical protein